MKAHQSEGAKAKTAAGRPAESLPKKKPGPSKEEQQKQQQHPGKMDDEQQHKPGLLMGIELGSHMSAIVCGTAKTAEETACAESDPRITKAYAASWVVFDKKIIKYGAEAAAYTAIEPRETLANLPLWLTVDDVEGARELEERVGYAPYPHVRLQRGHIFFDFHQAEERKEVPLAVALGLLLQHLQVLGNPSGVEQQRRVVRLAGFLHMCSYDSASGHIQHPAAVCVVVPSATSRRNIKILETAACIAGLPPPFLLRRIDALINRFACDDLHHIYHHFAKQQRKQPSLHCPHPHRRNSQEGRVGVEERGEMDVYVALLDFDFLETSLAILRLHALTSASSVVEMVAATAGEDGAGKDKTQRQPHDVACDVVARRVDPYLGFSDVIARVARHVAVHLEKHYNAVVRTHSRGSWRLQAACVRAIEELYDAEETTIDLGDFAVEGTDMFLRFTQRHFEEICQPLAEKLQGFLGETLYRAGLSPRQLALIEVASVSRCARMRWLLQRLDRMRGADAAAAPERAAAAAETATEAAAAAVEEAVVAESACPAALPGISPTLFDFPGPLRFLQSSAAAAAGALYFCAGRGRFVTTLLQQQQQPECGIKRRDKEEEEEPGTADSSKAQGVTTENLETMAAAARATQTDDIRAFSQIAHNLLAEEAKELRLRSIAAYVESHTRGVYEVFAKPEELLHHRRQGSSRSRSSSGSSSSSSSSESSGSSSSENSGNSSSNGGTSSNGGSRGSTGGGGDAEEKEGVVGRMESFLRRAATASYDEVQAKYEAFRTFLLQQHTQAAETQTDDASQSAEKREQKAKRLAEKKRQKEKEKAQQPHETTEEEGEQSGRDEEPTAAAAGASEAEDDGARSSSSSTPEKQLKKLLPRGGPPRTKAMERLILELKISEGSNKPLRYYLDRLEEDVKEARLRNDNGQSEVAMYLAKRAWEALQHIVHLQEGADYSPSKQSPWLEVIEVDIHVEMARASLASAEAEHAVSVRRQELDDVVKHCDCALSKNPDRPEAFYYRAKAFLLLGEYRQAYEDCTAGLALTPRDRRMQGLRLVIERYLETHGLPKT